MLSYSEIDKKYQAALDRARGLPKPGLGRDSIIVATYDSMPAARILYMGCLHAGLPCTLAEPTLASVSITPYRETGSVVAFTSNPKSLRIVNLAEAASILGLDVWVVAPSLHPAVRERLESAGAEIILTGDPGLLTMSIAATLWVPKLMGAREARFRAELEELGSALEWLAGGAVQGYMEMRSEGLSKPPLYTPIAAPGAFYHCVALRCGVPIPLEAAALSGYQGSIVYASSVEIHDYRDILSSPGRVSRRLLIQIGSDPVTAGLYSVLAAALVTGRVV